jgi:hypothetical protein
MPKSLEHCTSGTDLTGFKKGPLVASSSAQSGGARAAASIYIAHDLSAADEVEGLHRHGLDNDDDIDPDIEEVPGPAAVEQSHGAGSRGSTGGGFDASVSADGALPGSVARYD